MSEIINTEEDLNEIISSMENIDTEENETTVDLFDDLKVVTPFSQSKPEIKSTINYSPASNTDEECTVIGSSTVITSPVTCGGNINIKGHIIGKLVVSGATEIYGVVEGDIETGEIVIHNGAKVVGNVICKSDAKLACGGDVVGDVVAKNAYIEASVKGNVEVASELKLSDTASINGDIVAGNISVPLGAIINGRLSIKR